MTPSPTAATRSSGRVDPAMTGLRWRAGIGAVLAACVLAVGSCAPAGGGGGAAVGSGASERSVREDAMEASRLIELERAAYVSNSLLRFETAETDYRETLSLARRVFEDDPLRASELRLHLAINKSNLGQFETAEQLFELSMDVVRDLGELSAQAKPDIFYAQHLLNQKLYDRGEAQIRKAIKLISDLLASGDTELTRVEQLNRNALPVAEGGGIVIDEALADVINTGGDTRLSGLSEGGVMLTDVQRLRLQRVHSYYILARAILAQGRDPSEIDPLLAAADLDLSAVNPVFARWLRAEIIGLEADRLRQQGRMEEAIVRLRDSIEVLRLYEIDSRPEALTLFKIGEIEITRGNVAEGQKAYRDAIAILENDSRGIELGQAQAIVGQLLRRIDAGERQAMREFFVLLQRFRTTATAQTLAQLSARLAAGGDEASKYIRSVQDLEREINILAAKVDRLETDPDADLHVLRVTESKLAEARKQLEQDRLTLQEIAPEYEQLLDATISLDDAQDALREGEVMAVIQLGPDGGLVAVLTKDSFEAFEVAVSIEVAEAEVRALREPIDGQYILPFDLNRAYGLFRELLGPAAETVREAEHLIVSPSGPLMSLPFTVLLTEAHVGDIQIVDGSYFDYSQVQFLGRQMAVTQAVSTSSFFSLRGIQPSAAPRTLLGFADFAPFGGDGGTITRISTERGLPESCRPSVAALGTLNPLPGTREELLEVEAAIGGMSKSYFGEDFTDAAVGQIPLSDYRVLHFATHGLLAQDPECLPEPALVTSLAPGGDSLLETSEIVKLSLDADIVILSACDTSAGAGVGSAAQTGFRGAGGSYAAGGESLGGLARSFFYAGARNIISSQWSVDDFATKDLMVTFYGAIAADDEITIAEALRQAQVKQISGGVLSHPFFWAPFITIGDGGRVVTFASAADPAAAPEAPATEEEAAPEGEAELEADPEAGEPASEG